MLSASISLSRTTMFHASTPNQGYSGRRSSHGGPKGETGNIWEVVSALANTLLDARNQLVSLIHTSKFDPLRLSGGHCCIDQCRQAVRDLHRAHAHGHAAFGASSEYPVAPRRSREMSSQQAYSSPPAPAGRRCTHPLHGITHPHPNWPSGVLKSYRKSHSDDQSAPACVSFESRNDQATGSCHDCSPGPQHPRQHHCMAKQFASLLSHEAHQRRERRLAELEVLRDKRPPWSRY